MALREWLCQSLDIERILADTPYNPSMQVAIQVITFLLGLYLVLIALLSAIRTFVLPRSAPDWISRLVFRSLRRIFDFATRSTRDYLRRDAFMAYYAPLATLLLLPAWLFVVFIGYAFMYYASDLITWPIAFEISGSSLLTLGFTKGQTGVHTLLSFTEATFGLILVALLIAYLPTINAAFARRETAVNLLASRAGTPPTAVELLGRFHRLNSLHTLGSLWSTWENWFADVEESHTSLSALVTLRSPIPEQSWVTAAGAILDAASLYLSTLDHAPPGETPNTYEGQQLPSNPQAALAIRTGFLALRRIADFFSIEYNHDPHFPQDPISISRQEFDEAYALMKEQALPLKEDRDQAWKDYAGWRVNYDKVLMALCKLTDAPPAPWSDGPPATFLYTRHPQN